MNYNIYTGFKRRVLLTVLFCIAVVNTNAQTKWELKKSEDWIKVYSGSVPNSNLKAVKVECTIDATMPQLMNLLMDAKAHEEWVYNTKNCYTVKKISSTELIYYSEFTLPWPLQNRYIVVHLKLEPNTDNTVLKVSSVAIPGYVTENDIVRIRSSTVTWTVTAINTKQLKIDYVANADPGGSIPAWVTNMFCTAGPYETFKQLRVTVLKPEYTN